MVDDQPLYWSEPWDKAEPKLKEEIYEMALFQRQDRFSIDRKWHQEALEEKQRPRKGYIRNRRRPDSPGHLVSF